MALSDNNGAPPGGNEKKDIGEVIRSAFTSGDLSRLKDLGPAVQDVVKNVADSVAGEVRNATGAQPNQPRQSQPQGNHPYKQDSRPVWMGASAVPRKKGGGISAGVVSIVFGVLGMVAFGLSGVVFAILALLGVAGFMWPLCGAFGGLFGASALLTGGGFSKRKIATRARDIYALLEKKEVMLIEDVAAELGRSPKEIKKDIRKAKKKGMLLDVRMDAGETTVMAGEDAYKLYLESEKTRAQREREEEERARRMKDPATAALEQFKSEGAATIRKIRIANEAIPGEEISGKLSELETTSARILSYVEEHPEKLPDTRKFMDYYLPTTLKLVEKYREYEQMEVQPANIQTAKKAIEESLDTVNVAFNNLLEGLYQPDTLDVTTDIEVLQHMLEQEGLTGRRFDIDAR